MGSEILAQHNSRSDLEMVSEGAINSPQKQFKNQDAGLSINGQGIMRQESGNLLPSSARAVAPVA